MKKLVAAVAAVMTMATAAQAQLVPTWRDVATEVGVRQDTRTWSANVADHDNDGDEDWLLIRHYPELSGAQGGIPRPVMWRNDAGVFVQENWTGVFANRDRHDCDWGDVETDGDLDLVCAVGLSGTSRSEVFLNDGTGKLSGGQDGWGGLDSPIQGRARTANFLDANGDTFLDLFINRWQRSGAPDFGNPDRFYLGATGSKGYSVVNAPEWGVNVTSGTTHGVKTCNDEFDYDLDLDDDLLVCTNKQMKLWSNDTDHFTNVSPALGLKGHMYDAELVDLDHLGRPDLVRLNQYQLNYRLATASGFGVARTIDLRTASGVGTGVNLATGDYDGDLDQDVYVVRSCTTPDRDQADNDTPDYVLTNDGLGTLTKSFETPAETRGCGQTAEEIDYDSDGTAEFVVLNGREDSSGFTQLWDYE